MLPFPFLLLSDKMFSVISKIFQMSWQDKLNRYKFCKHALCAKKVKESNFKMTSTLRIANSSKLKHSIFNSTLNI